MEPIFESFFAESNLFCGSEKTLHALFCHNLVKNGFDHRTISREFRLGKSPVDVVLMNADSAQGDHPKAAIEFKGGAYGNRNALYDTIDASGHCSDLDKLEPYAKMDIECWFVCVDMAELGIALSGNARQLVAEECRKRNIRFAYYCQGENHFLVTGPRGLVSLPVIPSKTGKTRATPPETGSLTSWVKQTSSLCSGVDASEDSYVAWLYHALRDSGYGAQQLSLETYFNCAAVNGSRMQLRPDMAIFAPELEGNFNLYRQGDRKRPNDTHKLAHLLAILEVKGSQATTRMSDARFAKQIDDDLEKLGRWRQILSDAHPQGRAKQAAYVMMVLDRKRRSGSLRTGLENKADVNGVHLIYLEI